MSRYIDADALLDIAKNKYHDIIAGRYPFNIVVYDLVQIIEEQPTLDLAPVVHGEWDFIGDYDSRCSVCGEEYCIGPNEDYNFCPNCGADMRKEEHHASED